MRTETNPKTRLSLFIDLKAAYDNVRHSKLFQILFDRAQKLYPNDDHIRSLVKIIQFSYQTSTMVVSNYAFLCEKGVTQGSVLSPLLFNIYLEHLIQSDDILRPKQDRTRRLLY